MSFTETENLVRERRKGRKVKWLIQLLWSFWIRKIFFVSSQQKHFLTSCSLCCLFFFFFPTQLKQFLERSIINVGSGQGNMFNKLPPGLMVTPLPEYPCASP